MLKGPKRNFVLLLLLGCLESWAKKFSNGTKVFPSGTKNVPIGTKKFHSDTKLTE